MHCAPVLYEDHPTYANLISRIEHMQELGALVTDFTLIRPGALHRANGGYLLLDVIKLLQQPFAWESLKRATYARDSDRALGQALGLVCPSSLCSSPRYINTSLLGTTRSGRA